MQQVMKDPLMFLTVIVGMVILLIFANYVFAGQINDKVLTALGTMFGILVSALTASGRSARKKEEAETEKEEDNKDARSSE